MSTLKRHDTLRKWEVIDDIRQCINCDNWQPPDGTEDIGECRGNMPALYVSEDGNGAAWPPTEAEQWCGQFKLKELQGRPREGRNHMPRAILVFKLPQEQDEYTMASQGADYYSTLCEFDEWLRGKIKHGDLPEDEEKILQQARDQLYIVMDNNGVYLELG